MHKLFISRSLRLASIGLIGVAAASAQAQTDGRWHGSVAAGGALASGNTTSQALTIGADGVKATTADKTTLYGLANFAQSTVNDVTTKTSELFRLGGRYDYNLSAQYFAFGGAEAETNKAQGLDSRYAANAGLGYKMIRTPSTTWDLFAGLGYSSTRYTVDLTRKGVELVLGEESTHKLSDTTSFKQRLMVFPGQDDLGVRSTFDATLSTAISGGWTLNVGAAVRHASKVPDGTKNVDSLVTVGFGYKY